MTKFEKQCIEVNEKLGLGEIMFFPEPGRKPEVFEDDGTLHVVRRGQRACFDVSNGQDYSARKQNGVTRKVLDALGITLTPKQERSVFLKDEPDQDEPAEGWDY